MQTLDKSDTAAIAQRIAKLKKRAKQVRDPAHLRVILDSFPQTQRREIFESVQHLLPFDAKWPIRRSGKW